MNTDWEKEWEESEVCKRIARLESFAIAHGWTGFQGENVPDFIRNQISLAEKRGAEKAVEFIRKNFNDQNYEEWSGLAHDDEATEEEEEAAFWMMWGQLLEQARNL